jgi:hypothetical protein
MRSDRTEAESECDLLLGVMACRMGFISQEALVSATRTQVREKSKTLGQILITKGVLDKETQLLLKSLVERHLSVHNGETTRSFAAISAGDILCSLLIVDDQDLQRSLSKFSSPLSQTEDPYATRLPDLEAIALGTNRSRFRVVKLHARGGLGEVFIARDDELDREVALKEIQDRYADHPESRSRFVREATITGGLEHPGIVPIHSLGRYPDGRPYYIMRFINGQSLREAIDAYHAEAGSKGSRHVEPMRLRGLLRHFIDACNAIDYAHTRGVIHRDLKPSNIMLGRFGETLVVDWGLAKVVRRGPDGEPGSWNSDTDRFQTRAGAHLGTPQYMSPEQASGGLDSIGPASDVYSLGATLYTILTGRPAFDHTDLDCVLRDVRQGSFPPPRELNHEVGRSLNAICMRAMGLRPQRRYASARALADDIELWLADEPIAAYREPAPKRLWRWAQHHRWVGRAVGLVTVLIVTIFLFSTLFFAALGLILAALGAIAGAIVGIVRGGARKGARRGAILGFRFGTAAGAALAVLWIVLKTLFHVDYVHEIMTIMRA